MQDTYEMKMVIGYVKNIIRSKKMAYSNINNLANFIDSMIPVLNLTSKHNKLLEVIEESVGWKVDRFQSKSKIIAIRNAISTIIDEHESLVTIVKSGEFDSRIKALSVTLGLNKSEQNFFGFLVRYQHHDQLNQLINDMTSNGTDIKELCKVCLNLSKDNLTKTLARNGRFLTSGAVEYQGSAGKYLNDCFAVPDLIIAALQKANTSNDDVLQFILGEPEKATLDWQDFDHIANSRDRLLPFLRNAVSQQVSGINVLLHGPPGTGKTEFCKTMASRLGLDLYSLSEQCQDGDEPSRRDRLSGYRLAQNLLRKSGGSILLFDEMDDLFSSHLVYSLLNVRASSGSKIFMNRLLEDNHIPTIWTINDPQLLDETIIRRMSIAVKITKPTPKTLKKLWGKHLSDYEVNIPEDEIELLAQSGASPAVINSAVKFSKLSEGKSDDCMFVAKSIVNAIDGKPPVVAKPVEEFRYELVVSNTDLRSLTSMLLESKGKNCSFCFYGPPGTGKSLYARYLAKRLNMPVLYKRASDLLSMWVGGSEKNIAGAFSEAIESESFLIFDEADSLLSDRRRARASWEVTQVNEMLTWMEQHPLPFACTTNLREALDQASMRRFTFKVHFDYLDKKAICKAFKHFFRTNISDEMAASINFVTPGDFAVVKKKALFHREGISIEGLIEMIKDEVRNKNEHIPTTIGF
jgi:SpoVK/Ycf46/Vps4 family AAA+-type ATPase